jgi:N6-adenosine-specific RNA methylase IME4
LARPGEVGLLHPIVADSRYRLNAGERRLASAKHLGWTTIPVTVARNLDDIVEARKAERDEDVERKDLTPEEAVAMADSLLPFEKQAADVRRRDGNSRGGSSSAKPKRKTVTEKLSTTVDGKRAKAKATEAAGMSRPTYEKAKAVMEAAKAEPDQFRPLVDEMNRTGRVAGVHRKLKTKPQAMKIAAEPAPTPEGPFRVIVADPPWLYDARAADDSHRAANPYPSMSIDEICEYRTGERAVADLAHQDCVLLLWTTNAHLLEASRLLEAWGFQYKTTLTWVKNKIGTGDWLRGRTEYCLFAVKGKPTVVLGSESTALLADAGQHSEKPEAFYQLVEKLCPGSKLERFARRKRDGWVSYGSEI